MSRLFQALAVAALVVLGAQVACLRRESRVRDAIAGVG